MILFSVTQKGIHQAVLLYVPPRWRRSIVYSTSEYHKFLATVEFSSNFILFVYKPTYIHTHSRMLHFIPMGFRRKSVDLFQIFIPSFEYFMLTIYLQTQQFTAYKYNTMQNKPVHLAGPSMALVLNLHSIRGCYTIVQEPKDKRKGSLSFNSRVWQPCGSKCTFMLQ